MIVEERIYTLHPGGVAKYMKLYEDEGFAIQEPILGNLVGWYFADWGTLNQIIHMWGYDSHEERTKRRAVRGNSFEWQGFAAKMRPLIRTQENKCLHPAPWSPVT